MNDWIERLEEFVEELVEHPLVLAVLTAALLSNGLVEASGSARGAVAKIACVTPTLVSRLMDGVTEESLWCREGEHRGGWERRVHVQIFVGADALPCRSPRQVRISRMSIS